MPETPLALDVLHLARRVIEGHALTRPQARALVDVDPDELIKAAELLREHFRGDVVELCSIVNARSGQCEQDCGFCAQSAHHNTAAPSYDLLEQATITRAYNDAADRGAHRFGIISAGGRAKPEVVRTVREVVSRNRGRRRTSWCCSLGMLDREEFVSLREAGITRVHHNLETSRRHFPEIITTHRFEDRCETVRAAKAAGLSTCSGGIFGMGEDWEDRIDLAFTLRELDVDSIPINFLMTIEGTRLAKQAPANPLTPETCLRIIAVFRFVNPSKEIRVAGGRENHLGERQQRMFAAGADSTLIGNYLTTYGRPPEQDVAMVRDLGMRLKFEDELHRREHHRDHAPSTQIPAAPGTLLPAHPAKAMGDET